MSSLIVVHPSFDAHWPWAADYFQRLWKDQGPLEFIRTRADDHRPLSQVSGNPSAVTRVVSLGGVFSEACVADFTNLRECAVTNSFENPTIQAALVAKGVKVYTQPSEGFWGQSVSEFGLALTLCGLRRIPQTHHRILTAHDDWEYGPVGGVGQPGKRGYQYGDDSRFTNGTLEGKRVRIVGAGNIASRYASFASALGADVAAWDPYAAEPCFHRAGSRREWHLDRLVRDAEIFVPMVPLTDKTKGLITAAHIDALPQGCLVVMVTRANICDMPSVRRRVLADELALAADVFDVEPLPLNDPLLGRDNVVHTPHNAGRTRQANEAFAQNLAEQFLPR